MPIYKEGFLHPYPKVNFTVNTITIMVADVNDSNIDNHLAPDETILKKELATETLRALLKRL